jgi:hypothetical protein
MVILTVVIPIPAIIELDRLALNPTPLGEVAKGVSLATDALKVQMLCGNYSTFHH